LLAELENFESGLAPDARAAMPIARRALVRLINDGVSESASQSAQLRQAEAVAEVAELERGLQGLTVLGVKRADAWREATHDLRGSVGVLQTVSAILDREGAPEAVRSQSLRVLKRGVLSLHELLSNLVDLARLDAGQDQLYLDTFDAAAALRELCESLRQMATERSLFLRTTGPTVLEVQGDRIKVLRVAQNLLLNALRFAREGGVTVEWHVHGTSERPRWQVSIADSAPPGSPRRRARRLPMRSSRLRVKLTRPVALRKVLRRAMTARGRLRLAHTLTRIPPMGRASGLRASSVCVSSLRHPSSWKATTPAQPFECHCRASIADKRVPRRSADALVRISHS
jgi:hypothetical protein